MAKESPIYSYDEFLGYSPSAGGGKFLADWKDEGSIDVLLHPAGGVFPRWAHKFWQIGKRKEKGHEIDAINFMRWNCHERDVILKKQRFRLDDGRREYPPEVDPMCRFIEHVRDLIRSGKLSWVAPLFEWTLDDDDLVVLAGGFVGLFGRPTAEYTKDELAQLRKAGVERDESFKTNGIAKRDFIFRVVPVGEAASDGCVIAPFADALGIKVQKAIRDRVESTRGAYKPSRDPLALRLKYDDSKDFSDKYDVVTLTEYKPTDVELEALAKEPPSIDREVAPGSVSLIRALMEKHCVVDGMPWDALFEGAEDDGTADGTDFDPEKIERPRAQAQVPATPPAAPARPAVQPAAPPPPAQAPTSANVPVVAPAEPGSPFYFKDAPARLGEDMECEVCSGPNGEANATKCRHCGAEYDSFTGALTYDPRSGPKPGAAPAPAALPPAEKPAESPAPQARRPARRARGA